MTRSDATRWPVWALIRRARELAGLTQAQLAERAGTSQPAIARYEKARAMPDLGTLHRIVEACGFELRLELGEPDGQRRANDEAALARSLEDRLLTNEAWTEMAAQVRQAGRDRLGRGRPKRLRTPQDLEEFFAEINRDQAGREPDWEEHLAVINRSRWKASG